MYLIPVAVLSIIIATFGMAGRGTWSPNIARIASVAWLILVISIFISLGWKLGVVIAFTSFVVGNIFLKFFKKILKTKNRPSLLEIEEENQKVQKEIKELQEIVKSKKI